MAILIKCDVCSHSINERSAGWVEVTTHRGENPRTHQLCSPECGETFMLRQRAVGERAVTEADFEFVRELLARKRADRSAEAWEERPAS